MWEGQDREEGDSSEWNVNEDWESGFGLVNDVFGVSESTDWSALKEQFADEAVFLEALGALEVLKGKGDDAAKRKAQHKAGRFMVEGNCLWKVGGNDGVRDRARVECITKAEAQQMAVQQHDAGGHWGWDHIKLALLDRICSPKLDDSVMVAIRDCAKCKNFGASHIHALLNLIT
ncbi:hypothetical protein GYMLUDRAFT_171114 [Collybiopsis luxurians FD-317 M1]|uniref:Integrase zinc-binding domain-containing protein n=1 Tax=Collybiopsis luxurians FD-317 M1 TaxID=944289 RepID=A0A0D0B576_9AGAR|nr:hypothetical protein GYMLUDRAFT_171114 [Collybiopsis luxurians FD-317 M1]